MKTNFTTQFLSILNENNTLNLLIKIHSLFVLLYTCVPKTPHTPLRKQNILGQCILDIAYFNLKQEIPIK